MLGYKKIEEILRMPATKTKKKNALVKLFVLEKKQKQAIEFMTLLSGGKAKMSVLFDDVSLADGEITTVEFGSPQYKERFDGYAAALGDRIEVLERVKALYDWSVLAEIMQGQTTISDAQIQLYDLHKADLELLKKAVRKYNGQAAYRKLFWDDKQEDNYVAYIGKANVYKAKKEDKKEKFYNRVHALLKSYDEDPDVKTILDKMDQGIFLPLQSSSDNVAIPYQLHLAELRTILTTAEKYFPFLSEKDESGLTVSDKICSIMTFRIPYYVGPLNTSHAQADGKGFCWMVRKEPGAIRPWNFKDKVDTDASAERFIQRMTNTCSYLIGEDVLPKDSLLYCSYNLLNHINNLRVDGEKISVQTKQELYDWLKYKNSIRLKDIRHFLQSKGVLQGDAMLTGMDEEVRLSMKSWADFRKIIGSKHFDTELAEKCILTIVLFGQEKNMVVRRIKELGKGTLTEEQIRRIARLNYSGWGRLSRKFLTGIYSVDAATGEAVSIMRALHETNDNLMQILSTRYNFGKAIEETNAQIQGAVTEFSYDALVEPLYCSPAVKRGIWRTLNIVREIEKITGHPPNKIFVEMAREQGEKKRTISRKKQLQTFYEKCKDEQRDWMAELNNLSEADLRKDKLYLYYMQMGRCMYSGEIIELSDLFNNNLYDIDHIYPRSKTKDDSLDNRVLVKQSLNKSKGDNYPIPDTCLCREKAHRLWNLLLSKDMISKEKYHRLMRQDGFTPEELSGFINRQLVETRQSTKAIAEALQTLYGQIVVFVKAGLVSDFRRDYKFVKVRELNDYHHAKDAYLNIVVGNVYDTKFTRDPANFIRNARTGSYSLNKMFDYDVSRGGVYAWHSGNSGSIATVKNTMRGNRILFTRYAHDATGEFYKQQPLKKGHGQVPLKTSDPRFANIEQYGGYDKAATAYFFLVEHTVKKRKVRTLETVPIRCTAQINGLESLVCYCENELRLQNPRILIPKIKIDTLFRIEGFPMHISGKSGDKVTYKVAAQLILPMEKEGYLKRISKFVERRKAKLADQVTVFDMISPEKNIALYDLLIKKQRDTIYAKRPASQLQVMEKGRNTFIKLSVEEQCSALMNILTLFQCVFARADLRAIGGSGQAGTVSRNKNLSGCTQAILIHQSVTGLFEQRIDLLKL